MKKEHLQVIKDAIDNMTAINEKVEVVVTAAIADIDKEIENLGNLADKFQAEFDEMSEKVQEGDKGTALEELIESIGEVKSDLEDMKDELDSEPMGDILDKLETIRDK